MGLTMGVPGLHTEFLFTALDRIRRAEDETMTRILGLLSNDQIDALPCLWCEGTGRRLDENGEPTRVPCPRCHPDPEPEVDPDDFVSDDPEDIPF